MDSPAERPEGARSRILHEFSAARAAAPLGRIATCRLKRGKKEFPCCEMYSRRRIVGQIPGELLKIEFCGKKSKKDLTKCIISDTVFLGLDIF